ncbi:MAG: DMT family transporter [Hydrogenophilaceae bacterium]|nr:DMT family transporter [Hydrogenophilaceae bacterium]
MLVAGASFAAMGVCVKLAAQWFSSEELVFYRSVFGLVVIAIAVLWWHGREARQHLFGQYFLLHLSRGVVGFIALMLFFYSLTRLPLAAAITLNYTSPLFLALAMPFWLKERPSLLQYFSVMLGFVGVVLLLRPWQAGGDVLAGLAGLLSGLLAAWAYVHVRQLGQLREPEWRTVLWFTVVASVGAAVFATTGEWHPLAWNNIGLLLALGFFATLGQFGMTRAYKRGQTVVVASFAFSTVVFGALLDVLIWNDPLPMLAWFGIALTVGAGLWAVYLNEKRKTT